MAAPHPSLSERKAAARRAARAVRAGLDPGLGALLTAQALPLVPPGALVGGFWPMGSEIDIRPLLQALAGRGHALALPVTPPRGLPLVFRRWAWGEPLAAGPMGTQQPLAGEAVTPTLLLVPLLAFDAARRRLGYGGGYYDITLAGLPGVRSIGCAQAALQVAEVPVGPQDVALDMIVTEKGVIG